ncbi:FGGY-family carbohydrate kinase [Cognatiyoonia sp. IB215446]|uniref:FGGY-family carbohydrate kinase n=1 Tax=Cognatiyoonia sp. IB215446 TaxID=3097355 RepID=UPI002A143691|nr:FGGY-family carbohydrate kinase [Cognatiyoonia sp. IB215446]MDX8350227.1 FGGY-family carbohydrate kinase [Cognatiyoonia sp. IB215446]
MTGLAVGIDLGTSGVRSAVVDAAGKPLSFARSSYGGPEDSRDPACWWQAVTQCMRAQISALEDNDISPTDIRSIAVDGTSGTLVLVDKTHNPVTHALMYSDGGFDAEASKISRHAPDPHITRGSASALARAMYLVAKDGDGRAAHLLHQADFIAAKLRGTGAVSDVNNALKTGCDPAQATWPDWIGALLPVQLLPDLVSPGTEVGPVSSQVSDEFGLPRQTMIHAGTTDSIAAFLAATPPKPGAAVTSIGTTLAIKLFSHKRIDAPEMGLYAHRLGEGWLVGGASNTGGGVLRAHFSDAKLVTLSAQIDPTQSSGLDYYPLLKPGERFPINDPCLPPRLTPRPANDAAFLHGIFDGIARIEHQAYTLLKEHGAEWPQLILTAGGASRNPVLTQIRERVLKLPVEAAAEVEAAVGTAKLALTSGRTFSSEIPKT